MAKRLGDIAGQRTFILLGVLLPGFQEMENIIKLIKLLATQNWETQDLLCCYMLGMEKHNINLKM